MDIVTLGMFIIDEIYFQSPKEPELDVLGGAGSWAVVGARFFRPAPSSKRIGWTIHKGSDFPSTVEDEINSWDTTCNFIATPDRLTTRGWNKYGDDEERAFRYLTEKLRVDETQLTDDLLLAKCFHLICTPTRCINLVEGILARRQKMVSTHPNAINNPYFVWEPVPDSCGPDELGNVFKALKYVDVVSPNHQELAALFQARDPSTPTDIASSMEAQCAELLGKGFGSKIGAVMVRCGERGCFIATVKGNATMPAYHDSTQAPTKVTDPTGAGNAFLGGFCAGILDKHPGGDSAFMNGAAYGSVAASFAVQQVGLPKLTKDQNGCELWNGESVAERVKTFWDRLGRIKSDGMITGL